LIFFRDVEINRHWYHQHPYFLRGTLSATMHDKENPRSEDVDDGRRASSDFNTSSDVEKNAPSAIDDNRHSKPTDEGQNDADLSDQTTEAGNLDDTAAESFEVSWDGDKDPMCPRSMSRVRKWVIVSIACMGSLCV
jgi:hypothetical protein